MGAFSCVRPDAYQPGQYRAPRPRDDLRRSWPLRQRTKHADGISAFPAVERGGEGNDPRHAGARTRNLVRDRARARRDRARLRPDFGSLCIRRLRFGHPGMTADFATKARPTAAGAATALQGFARPQWCPPMTDGEPR